MSAYRLKDRGRASGKGLHAKRGTRRKAIGMAETISCLTIFVAVASYSYHMAIAFREGYPIELIKPSPWDCLPGLIMALPLIVAAPFSCYRIVRANGMFEQELNEHGKAGEAWRAARIFASMALGLAPYVLIVLANAGASIPVAGALMVTAGFILLCSFVLPFATARWNPGSIGTAWLLSVLEVEAAVGWLYLYPLVATVIRFWHLPIHLSTLCYTLTILCVVTIQWALAMQEKERKRDMRRKIKKSLNDFRDRGLLIKLAVAIFVSMTVGVVSSLPTSLNALEVSKNEDGEEKSYLVLDVFDSRSAVVRMMRANNQDAVDHGGRSGAQRAAVEYLLIDLSDGYLIKEG